ncbi:MAG: hypothetical protein AB8F74_11985 [Saprospiraceae bacterium]
MFNSKSIQYLHRFSSKDLQAFQLFVASPYFNKHQNTIALFHYLQKLKKWNEETLGKAIVFKAIFPDKKYDPQLLSNLNSYLLKLIRQFLIQRKLESNSTERQLTLMESCFDNGQQNLFELTAGRLQKTLASDPIQDSIYHLQQNRFYELLDDFDLSYGNRSSGEHLEKALANFDIYVISKKLKMTCQVLARNQVTAQQYALSLIPEILQFIEKKRNHFQTIPSVWVYYLIYKMISQNAADYFNQLKEILPSQIQHFHHQEGHDLYTHLVNYCIRQINSGKAAFKREAFELYKQMLEYGLLYNNGILAQWNYTNITSLGCLLKEYDWVKKFIHQQKEKLSKEQKDNTFHFNLASFYYSQKDFDQALLHVREVIFTEVHYDLLTRILRVKIYFDQRDWSALEYELEKFRIFLLRNKKITDRRRKSALNLLRFAKLLMRLFQSKPISPKLEYKKERTTLKKSILENENVLNKDWLLQQLEA